jgi:hypothetical protein
MTPPSPSFSIILSTDALVTSSSSSRNSNVKSQEEVAKDITAVIVGYALKDFMGHMSSHVPSQDIVRRITQEQILGSRFAEFKDVMISMVESYAYEVSLYKTYLKINTGDILQLRAQRMKQKVCLSVLVSLYLLICLNVSTKLFVTMATSSL